MERYPAHSHNVAPAVQAKRAVTYTRRAVQANQPDGQPASGKGAVVSTVAGRVTVDLVLLPEGESLLPERGGGD